MRLFTGNQSDLIAIFNRDLTKATTLNNEEFITTSVVMSEFAIFVCVNLYV